jgi:hypothetical protein
MDFPAKSSKNLVMNMHRVLKVKFVLLGAIVLNNTSVSAHPWEDIVRTMPDKERNDFLQWRQEHAPCDDAPMALALWQSLQDASPVNIQAPVADAQRTIVLGRIDRLPPEKKSQFWTQKMDTEDVVTAWARWKSQSKSISTRFASRAYFMPSCRLQREAPLPSYHLNSSVNLVSPIGLRNAGTDSVVAALQLLYTIPEFRRRPWASACNGNRASLSFFLSELFQAMSVGDKEKANTTLNRILANYGHILRVRGNAVPIENLLTHLIQEEPEIRPLIQINLKIRSWPTLAQTPPANYPEIIASGIPEVSSKGQTVCLDLGEGATSIEGGIMDWFHIMHDRYTNSNGEHYILYSETKTIEGPFPPYIFINMKAFPYDIPEILDLCSYGQGNRSVNYGLVGVLSHTTPRGAHAIAYIKDGVNWVKFDNENRQQIHSLQNIKGQGVTFLYQKQ